MLRTIWFGDSSKEKYKHRFPAPHAARHSEAASVDLPVPAVPDTRTLLPLK
jgi:hypothetical protein